MRQSAEPLIIYAMPMEIFGQIGAMPILPAHPISIFKIKAISLIGHATRNIMSLSRLISIPADKVIISAKLILHQWGNTGTLDLAKPSLVQVMTIKDSWDESTLTWNNAPLAQENVSQTWVDPVNCDISGGLGWPCVPREWDVSRAVNQAYATGKPLQLALYSADSDYHSGKLFTTSDTGDWNADGRPTLVITWGNP